MKVRRAKPDKVGLAEAFAGGRGRLSHGYGRAKVARHQAAVRRRVGGDILSRRNLRRRVRGCAGHAGEPAAGLSGFAERMKTHAQPEGRPPGPAIITDLGAKVMETLEATEHLGVR